MSKKLKFKRGDVVKRHSHLKRLPPFLSDEEMIVLDSMGVGVGRKKYDHERVHVRSKNRSRVDGWVYAEDLELVERSKGEKRNPYSFTKKGERMKRGIERAGGYGKRTPAVAVATTYAAAKKGVPGLVEKKWARKHGYPTRKKNPVSSEFRKGAARALWASLYSSEIDDLKNEGYEDLVPGSGEDVMDYLPEVPEVAEKDAERFEKEIVKVNQVRNIEELIDRAARADDREVDAEDFGFYVMMSALGEGVSWFDDHRDFDLRLPHWEASVEVQSTMDDILEELKSEYEDYEGD